ncbi:unnamed protein product [Penicillium nalgiovense]|nr:unnamed protein product [Penicillium nalgiovense]CAG8041389.1 unnamed protein product [Penicillium nalgiovense]CAG8058634.1 unnamed protein product [Penicillium nalgiovense]CAG8060245.1 unnamed protein product [Penicillium nalgiovense]CAG8119718.1 unnamed protein product [Penicillium nalgiovense]
MHIYVFIITLLFLEGNSSSSWLTASHICASGKHHKYYAAKGKLRYPITLFIRIHIWLERIQITTALRPNLPAFYVVGLLGYCQGQTHTTHTSSVANCSDPSIRFSFDLLNALHPVSEEIGSIVPSDGIKPLKGYPDFSSWFVLVYFLGAGATLLTMIFGVGSIAFAWKVKLISVITAFLSLIFLMLGSTSITAVYSLFFFAIQNTLHPIGIHARLGGLFVAAWSAAGLSIAGLLAWMIVICCCCI